MKIKLFFSFLILFAFFTSCNFFNKQDSSSKANVAETTIELTYEVTADDGAFSIKFPAEPEFSIEPTETEVGTLFNKMYIYEYNVELSFMMAFCDYPQEYINQYEPYGMLKGAMEGFVEAIGMTIDQQEKIDIKGHEGIDFMASGGGYWGHMRDFLVENRLYQFGILSTSGPMNEVDTEAFLDSFKLH